MNRVAKSFPNRDMVKCVNDIIAVKEATFQFTNDKKRIESRIAQLEKERKNLTEENSNKDGSFNIELNSTIKQEIKNLQSLLGEFDLKICKNLIVEKIKIN